MKIFVVMCSLGEYSDRIEYAVMAFTNEDKAKGLVEKCSESARLLEEQIGIVHRVVEVYNKDKQKIVANHLSPDPFFKKHRSFHVRESNYYYEEIELLGE